MVSIFPNISFIYLYLGIWPFVVINNMALTKFDINFNIIGMQIVHK